MPFYEYECKACGAQTEVLQKITDKPLRKCAECGKNTLIKLVSAPIFRLKGGGWYETDFKTEQDKKRNLAGAEGKDDKAESK
ncbi:MAG: FmdB family zinc ribbon protein, partial [Gammaproteobacteria bacterium]